MANNKERIEPTESIHILLALRRNKENKHIDPDHSELCFHQVIRDYKSDIRILKERISSYPGIWRIHKTINSRHLQRSRIYLLKQLIDTDGSHDYRIDSLWKNALMNNPIKENILIDIDTKDPTTLKTVKTILQQNNIQIKEEAQTPHGFHIVCPTFDTRLIQNIENVDYQRDGYIFIEEVRVQVDIPSTECEHKIIQTISGHAVCEKCRKRFGWWCPNNPDRNKPYCVYNVDGRYCMYCGAPSERK